MLVQKFNLKILGAVLFSVFVLFTESRAEDPAACMNQCNENRCKANPALLADCEKWCGPGQRGLYERCKSVVPVSSAPVAVSPIPELAPPVANNTPKVEEKAKIIKTINQDLMRKARHIVRPIVARNLDKCQLTLDGIEDSNFIYGIHNFSRYTMTEMTLVDQLNADIIKYLRTGKNPTFVDREIPLDKKRTCTNVFDGVKEALLKENITLDTLGVGQEGEPGLPENGLLKFE